MSALFDYDFIDIHYHANPDLYIRRWNAIEAGKKYLSLNGAVVLKSHIGSTCIQATIAQDLGLPVFPSLVLNAITGGIQYRAILQALYEYQPLMNSKLIVDFPTITGRTIKSKLSRCFAHPYLSKHSQISETLFNNKQQLRNEVIDILKMANDYPIVLSTGHASEQEIYQLIDACIQYHVKALLLNQPANPLTGLNASVLKELAKNDFVWIEQTALTYLLGHQDKKDFEEVLTSVPRVLYSSDLGQTDQMDISNWLDFSIHIFNELGISHQRQEDLLRNNAIKLLSV